MADLLERLRSALSDRYAVERELGRGGMATVFLAEDLKHRRKVAIKVLHPELAVTLAADRFLNEIQIAAGLTHPHILSLIDSGEADGLPYYVMPYVDGESLRERLDREGELPVEEAVRIAVEVSDGLDYAHRQGVIHRDVKPGNILLSDRHAVVADVGVARAVTAAQQGRMTGTGLGVGTPLYASPEQATGAETLDGRTDVYSLGCVLYEMLTGEVPLSAPTPQAVQARRLTETPRPIHPVRETVPPLLDGVVAKALARRPADRWESAGAFGRALLTATMEATPVARLELAHVLGGEAPEAAKGRWRPWRWALLAGVVAVVAAGVWLETRQAGRTGTGRDSGTSAATDSATPTTEVRIPFEGAMLEHLRPGWGGGSFAISPDGRQLAYCSRDSTDDAGRLWLADLSAPDQPHRVLASGAYCISVSWDPFGDRIYFGADIAGHPNYYAISPHEGTPVPRLDCQSPPGEAWFDARWTWLSPDGTRIAFSSTPNGYLRILPAGSCDLAKSDSISMPGHPRGTTLRAWFARGDRLLVQTRQVGGASTLWSLRRDGRDARVLATQASGMDPISLPVGDTLVYFGRENPTGNRSVLRVRLASDGRAQGVPESLPHFDRHPISWFSLNRDGQRAVVARPTRRYRYVRVTADPDRDPPTAAVTPVADGVVGQGPFRVSHDGRWLAYVDAVRGGVDLFKVRIEGGSPERVTHSGTVTLRSDPAWSADDRYLTYGAPWQDSLRLWVATSDGERSGYFAGALPNVEQPDLAWEGDRLVFFNDHYKLEIVREYEIEDGQWIGGRWQPASAVPGGARTQTFRVRAKHEPMLDTLSEWGSTIVAFPYASPVGDRVLAVARSMSQGSWWVLISLEDASVKQLAMREGDWPFLGWTADGEALYWKKGSDVFRWDPDTGERQLVLSLPETVENCQPRPGVGGVEFICAVDESTTKLFLVDNFHAGTR
jgi:Tol biopolymer transport system component/tRNA A-37 threonylcarbamoyl transferase component Bud32